MSDQADVTGRDTYLLVEALTFTVEALSGLPIELRWEAQVQFAVGFKIQGKTGHVVVDAEDALIAALKVKMQRPEALIAYVRQQNKRGDTRHPMRRLANET